MQPANVVFCAVIDFNVAWKIQTVQSGIKDKKLNISVLFKVFFFKLTQSKCRHKKEILLQCVLYFISV